MLCLAAGMSHVRHVQGQQDRSSCRRNVPGSPGVLGSADIRVAEGHVRGQGSFVTRGEDPAAGIILPAPPTGRPVSSSGSFKGSSGVPSGVRGACGLGLPPLTALAIYKNPGDGSQVALIQLRVMFVPLPNALQAVLPGLQNRHHGPGSLNLFPAGMAGWRPPQPHRFLPG